MLIVHKINFELSLVILRLLLSQRFEELLDGVLDKQGTTQDAHDLNHWSTQFEILFNDGNETVCNDGDMYLDADCICRSTPKRFDFKMLLNPFEEQFHLPTVSIQKCDVLCFEIEVIGVIGERTMKLRSIVYNPSEFCRIVILVSLSCKADGLISEDIVFAFKSVLATDNLILGLTFLSDDKESIRLIDDKESGEVKIASIKDIACQWLVCKPVHGIRVVHIRVSDSVEDWDFGNDVNLRMDFDSRLCTSEVRPVKHRHAQIDGRRVNSIEPAMEFEFLGKPLLLSNGHHMESELFKYAIVSESVRFRQSISCDRIFTKSKMVRPLSMCNCNICELTQTATSDKLAEDQDQQMVPMREAPFRCSVDVLVDQSSEISLWKKHNKLGEEIMSTVHALYFLNEHAKVSNSNVGHTFLNIKCCA